MGQLQARFGVSQRRACRVAGQHRTTQRRPLPVRPGEEARLRARLRRIAREHPRLAWRVLRREPGRPLVGHQPQAHPAAVARGGPGSPGPEPQPPPGRSRADPAVAGRAPNQVWAIDFQFETADGRRLKLANIVQSTPAKPSPCAWPAPAPPMTWSRRWPADRRSWSTRAPALDNGPELLAWTLRDDCRLSPTRTSSIEPGSPWRTLCRVVQRPGPRRVAQPRGIHQPDLAQVVVEAWPSRTPPTGPTPPSTGKSPPSTQPPGPAPPTPHPHGNWTTNQAPSDR